jgi:REP element-mobilizing transposase RayT
MRAWLLTNTTYGSHLPGDVRGSVTSVRDLRPNDVLTTVRIEHDIPGEQCEEAMPGLHYAACAQMKGPAIYFDLEKANVVLAQFRETATFRGWVLRAVAIMPDHFHIVMQVHDDPDPRKLLADFKAYGSRVLNRKYGTPPSETWWTDKGSKRKLKNEEALAAAIHYVLKKQPNPLIVWSPDSAGSGEPRAN